MKKLVFALASLALAVLSVSLIAWSQFTGFLTSPKGGAAPGSEKVVVIPENTSAIELARILDKEGLIAHGDWLELYVERLAKPIRVHPGEYALAPTMSPIDMVGRIEAGKVVTYTVSIPPGSDAAQIAGLLADKQLAKRAELERLIHDRKTAESLNAPSSSLEGYLFPDAYDLPRGLLPKDLLAVLVAHYRRVVTPDIVDHARTRGLTENEMVTLASLIEKSDVIPSERRIYAALLYNRLKAQIPLGSRASVEYGLRKIGVRREEADKSQLDHPWNTVLTTGLPPTPIASPSLAAIMAAGEPAASKALYMVKRTDGTYIFCEDLDCYDAALKKFPLPEGEERVRPPKRRPR
jgi:UPF0755 protein